MNPFFKYKDRYTKLRSEILLTEDEALQTLIEESPGRVNNLIVSGLGMGTLFLRMGAVIQMSLRLNDGDSSNDALFIKQMMDNLRETLPSDTNWKNLWYASMHLGSKWEKAIPRFKDKTTILDQFVTFRNKFVHQYIKVIPSHSIELKKGLGILDEMSCMYPLYENTSIELIDDNYYWKDGADLLALHPFVQKGSYDDMPYLFQGMYDNKLKAKFINTILGDETIASENNAIDKQFEPFQKALKSGAGRIFDHAERMQYYRACFVGRERELSEVLNWVDGNNKGNVLPIYAEAGMGKGALTAGIIEALIDAKVPVLYHFCGSGMGNSLHSVLYHFILQGRNMPGMSGSGIWHIEDEKLHRKLERLPSRYHDAIKLFQTLVTDCYKPPSKYVNKPLIIIIDGLDEAAVANSQFRITDWFYTYNYKDEIDEDWVSPEYVKWIFTYRSFGEHSKGAFQLGGRFNLANIPLVQPLLGISEEAMREAFKPFEVSEEFNQKVMEKGAITK
jgi:hypothetical protein